MMKVEFKDKPMLVLNKTELNQLKTTIALCLNIEKYFPDLEPKAKLAADALTEIHNATGKLTIIQLNETLPPAGDTGGGEGGA